MERVVVLTAKDKRYNIDKAVAEAKTEVLKEFEKVCMTEMAFNRIKKDMHDIFDNLSKELKNQ